MDGRYGCGSVRGRRSASGEPSPVPEARLIDTLNHIFQRDGLPGSFATLVYLEVGATPER